LDDERRCTPLLFEGDACDPDAQVDVCAVAVRWVACRDSSMSAIVSALR
jgi:hypothetical protein